MKPTLKLNSAQKEVLDDILADEKCLFDNYGETVIELDNLWLGRDYTSRAICAEYASKNINKHLKPLGFLWDGDKCMGVEVE